MKLAKTRVGLGLAGSICGVSAIILTMYSAYGDELILSPAGAEIIGNAEGCRRDPYKCPADVLTVGIGSTEYSGLPIDPKHRYTDLEIAERWKNDIQVAEKWLMEMGERCHSLYLILPYQLLLTLVVVQFENQPYLNTLIQASMS